MGGIGRALFGGSKNKSSSGNRAFDEIRNLLSGNIGQGNSAMATIGALLGLGGDKAAADAAHQNYLNSSGYKAMMDSGQDAITTNASAKGLFRSGATGKALTNFGQQLGSQKFNEFLQQLTGLGQYGLNSANTITAAGQYGTGSGTSSGGIVNSLFSDRRLKTNIKLLRRSADGLGVYSYEYTNEPGVARIGVMADEVAVLRPEALGPVVDGYATVDYTQLREAA